MSLIFLVLFSFLKVHAEVASADEVKAAEEELAAEQAKEAKTNPPQAEPFAFADFTWLNGNSRQKNSVLDSKYFTGEVLIDVNYIQDFNYPKDHTLVGSTASGRTNEFELEHLGAGGDFHAALHRGWVAPRR